MPPASLDLSNWPGEGDDSLIFGWKRGMGKGAPLGSLGKSRVRLTARDGAQFDDAGRMDASGGSFHVMGATGPLLDAARQTNQLTLEAVLTTANLRQTGPARIISFSTDGYHRNFTLAQERDQLLLRLRTPNTGKNGMKPETRLCKLEAGKALHVIVTYRDGELAAYLNGKRVQLTDRVTGGFSNWDDEQQLVFGAEFRDGRNWDGVFDAIAILNRFIGGQEAVVRYKSAIGDAAKPVSAAPAPAPKNPSISPENARPVVLPAEATLHAGRASRLDVIAELRFAPKTAHRDLEVVAADGGILPSQWQARTGTLFVQIPGEFAAGASQRIEIRSAEAKSGAKPGVSVSEAGLHEGTDAWRIQTRAGAWFLAKTGAGIGSLEDLLLVQQTPDEHEDSYWPMHGNMTVFGFGRLGLDKFMTAAPNVFHARLVESAEGDALGGIAAQVAEPVGVAW